MLYKTISPPGTMCSALKRKSAWPHMCIFEYLRWEEDVCAFCKWTWTQVTFKAGELLWRCAAWCLFNSYVLSLWPWILSPLIFYHLNGKKKKYGFTTSSRKAIVIWFIISGNSYRNCHFFFNVICCKAGAGSYTKLAVRLFPRSDSKLDWVVGIKKKKTFFFWC